MPRPPIHRAHWLLGLLIWAPLAGAQDGFSLRLEGNRSPGKTLYLAIYRESAGNWQGPMSHSLKQPLPQDRQVIIELPLEPGRYAARAFVDRDGDGELDTRSLARPTEPYAISVGEGRSEPSIHFDRSVFTLSEDEPQARLKLRYPESE